jgi:hypothetical protein
MPVSFQGAKAHLGESAVAGLAFPALNESGCITFGVKRKVILIFWHQTQVIS